MLVVNTIREDHRNVSALVCPFHNVENCYWAMNVVGKYSLTFRTNNFDIESRNLDNAMEHPPTLPANGEALLK